MTGKLRLGEILIQEGKIDNDQLQSALAFQRRWGKKIGECFVQLGFLTEVALIETLARSLRLPVIDVTKIESSTVTRELLSKVQLQTARTNRIVPIAIKEIKGKKRLVVATNDPTNYKLLDDIQFKSGLPMVVMLAPDSDIEWFIRRYYLNEQETLSLNYVSRISVIESKDDKDGAFDIDPISSIFFDADFTGITNLKPSKPKDPKDKK